MRKQPARQSAAAVVAVHAQPEQAAVRRKLFGMRAQVHVARDGAAGVAHDPCAAPAGAADLGLRAGQEGGALAFRQAGAGRHRHEPGAVAAVVAQLVLEVVEEGREGLALDRDGKPVIGTGNKGMVYRIDSDITYTLLVNLPPTQVTGFASGRSFLFLTIEVGMRTPSLPTVWATLAISSGVASTSP